MSGIRAERVRKVFGSFEALKGVSLAVRDREFVVLLGPSGCGKTTLLRIIAGLESATDGAVYIGERDVTRLPARARGISMVFQNYAVFPHLTAYENIAFGLRMRKMEQGKVDERVRRSAAMMHIEHLLGRHPGQLSGGQRQRVAVARALAVEPEVLLMDEPLSNLDALLRLEMRAELKALLQETRTTTIYVTHDQVEAMSLADRIAVMQQGEIVQYDTPVNVYQNPANTFVGGFIGSPPMNFLKVQVDRSNGARVARVGGGELPVTDGGDRPLVLGVRPEDLEVVERATAGSFAARVQVLEPLGPHTLVTLSVDGQMLRATVSPDLKARPGDELWLRPNPNRVRWLDAETGRALPPRPPASPSQHR